MRRERPILKPRHTLLFSSVAFTAENDHNPEIWDQCPRCFGRGKISERDTGEDGTVEVYVGVECPVCKGSGTNGERVRYFDNDAPIADVPVSSDGWLTCPCCRWRFSIRDRNVWTGLRHARCGQRIRPVGGDA
jgi:hypothetical protein